MRRGGPIWSGAMAWVRGGWKKETKKRTSLHRLPPQPGLSNSPQIETLSAPRHASTDPTPQALFKLTRVDRLGQIVVHTGDKTAQVIAFQSV